MPVTECTVHTKNYEKKNIKYCDMFDANRHQRLVEVILALVQALLAHRHNARGELNIIRAGRLRATKEYFVKNLQYNMRMLSVQIDVGTGEINSQINIDSPVP